MVSGVGYATQSRVNDPAEKQAAYLPTLGLTAQLLDNIDDDTRSKIQLAALVSSGPEIGISLIEAVSATRILRTNYPAFNPAILSANEVRLALAQRDLVGFDAAWDFVRTHPKGADAWETIRLGIGNVNEATLFARDLKTLQKVADMMAEGSAFRTKFPTSWQSKLEEALFRNKHLNCSTCNGAFNRGPDMDEFLKDFEFINLYFDEASDIGKRFHAWSKRRYLNGNEIPVNHGHLSEAHQFLYMLRKKGLKEADINRIDGAFLDDVATSKKFDIELVAGPPQYFELKNKDFGGMQNLPTSDADQAVSATGAFSKIDKIEDFQWVAYIRRFGENADPVAAVSTLKNLWKPVFQTRKTEIFDAMKLELRNNLQLFSPDDLTTSKIEFILNKIIKAE
jgi:hypothetical protein